MIIYIDLDGTLRNVWEPFVRYGRLTAPSIKWPKDGPETYWFLKPYANHSRYPKLMRIWHKKNFFLHAEPYPNAIRAVKVLAQEYEVRLVTYPTNSETAHSENFQWIETWFDEEWAKERLFQVPDRTTEYGHFLIDDNPKIEGVLENDPFWLQIAFDQPYNRHRTDIPRITNWQQVIDLSPNFIHKLYEEFHNE